jgi:hypothetical protein
MESFFKGNIGLIYDPNIVTEILFNDPAVIVISLDEDNDKPTLDPENNQRVSMGTILLPDVETMWALSSGDFETFQMKYFMHLNEPEVAEFIFFLIGMAYKGFKIVFYYPDDTSEVIQYLHAFIEQTYGIHICIPSRQNDLFGFDINKIPMYLGGIYYQGLISADEYLYMMPVEVEIPPQIMDKLLIDLGAIGDSIEDKYRTITRIRQNKNKVNPFITLN